MSEAELRTEVEDLRAKLLKLEQRLTAQGATVGERLTKLEDQVKNLKSHVDPRHG